jgi:dimethylhistidine N-methyltransferase
MISSALPLLDVVPLALTLREEVLAGLSLTRKSLPCKFFYDDTGSRLFEKICEVDEYYLTRVELSILREHVEEMARLIGPCAGVVEFGSGAGVKTRLLLQALRDPVAYVPIEISRATLLASSRALSAEFPQLTILPVCADYTQGLAVPKLARAARVVVFFPGSTLGNFDPPEAVRFLRGVRGQCGGNGRLLLGLDLKKDRKTLEAAYNDAEGVTAAFNLNILTVINRLCDADFAVERFRHEATWNDAEGRIEMRLVSGCAQFVRIGGHRVFIAAGEAIVTEHCYKYDLADARGLAQKAGFDVATVWTDRERRFSVQLWRPE